MNVELRADDDRAGDVVDDVDANVYDDFPSDGASFPYSSKLLILQLLMFESSF